MRSVQLGLAHAAELMQDGVDNPRVASRLNRSRAWTGACKLNTETTKVSQSCPYKQPFSSDLELNLECD